VGGFFEQNGGGRRLQDEGEALVREDRDDDRQNHAVLVLGLGVEFFAERHDVDALSAEGGAHGRSRIGGAGGELEADVTLNFLGHGKWRDWWLVTCDGWAC